MTYLVLKSLHIVFMVAWYAGLFYLPRLFVYHAMETNADTIARFKTMERKLYFGIMMPSMVLTVVLGSILWLGYGVGRGQAWMGAKLALVAVLIGLHFYLGKLLKDFAADRNTHGHVFYRWLNEIPALPVLIGVVLLVVIKPWG
ncbi:MAG: CopD family protein [Betaproteobacteria bacterium]|nr:CopD family protein [Betaproteobacteria bacterium]